MSELSKKKEVVVARVIAQIILTLLILAAGFVGAQKLVAMKKMPKKKPSVIVAPLVEAIKVKSASAQIIVNGFGQVRAKHEAQIVSQVSGQLVSLEISDGEFFAHGEELVAIDPRDYELAVESAKAKVASAKVKLELEEAEAVVACEEWEELHPGTKPSSPLVLRIPQIKEAKANLLSAKSALSRAKLDLERTKISAPFDGRVVQKKADLGQYVTVGKPLADIYSTNVVEIQVPLENSQLAWFKIGSAGAYAKVSADFAGKIYSWTGKVVRSAGNVDAQSRMVHVIVEVNSPFDVSDGGVALIPGMFVTVEIQGDSLENTVVVPRAAIHEENSVWVANDGKLAIRHVAIARADRKNSYITSGLSDGDIVVVSVIEAAVDGMDVRCEIINENTSVEVAK